MPELPDSTKDRHIVQPERGAMFAEPAGERSFPTTAVAIAVAAIAILVALFVVLGYRHGAAPAPNILQPLAAYAPNLVVSGVTMSESTNLAGGKTTYIDGHIANHGPATVTGITVQVLFANDEAMPPQIETVALNLVRIREPEVDTEPVSAAPLAPNAEADFRLIFEGIQTNWNEQQPAIRATQVSTR